MTAAQEKTEKITRNSDGSDTLPAFAMNTLPIGMGVVNEADIQPAKALRKERQRQKERAEALSRQAKL